MAQGLFNIVVSVYAVVSAIAIGGLYKRFNMLYTLHKTQVEFNDEVINGFSITRKALTNQL